MSQFKQEDLEAMESHRISEEEEQKAPPRTPQQRAMAWVVLAVVLFGLGGTIYWMLTFVP